MPSQRNASVLQEGSVKNVSHDNLNLDEKKSSDGTVFECPCWHEESLVRCELNVMLKVNQIPKVTEMVEIV